MSDLVLKINTNITYYQWVWHENFDGIKTLIFLHPNSYSHMI